MSPMAGWLFGEAGLRLRLPPTRLPSTLRAGRRAATRAAPTSLQAWTPALPGRRAATRAAPTSLQAWTPALPGQAGGRPHKGRPYVFAGVDARAPRPEGGHEGRPYNWQAPAQWQLLQLRLEQLAQPPDAAAAGPGAAPPEWAAKVDISRRSRLLEHLVQASPFPLLPMRHNASNSWAHFAHLNS